MSDQEDAPGRVVVADVELQPVEVKDEDDAGVLAAGQHVVLQEEEIFTTVEGGDGTMEGAEGGVQQIYIIQTADGDVGLGAAGEELVVVAQPAGGEAAGEEVAVMQTVSALEQLSRGDGEVPVAEDGGGELTQVFEEVVLHTVPNGGVLDQLVDVAEVEVAAADSPEQMTGPHPVAVVSQPKARRKGSQGGKRRAAAGAGNHIVSVGGGAAGPQFHICRICNTFVAPEDIADHNQRNHTGTAELTCVDCGKIFKSKRSLFGHRKEKHSGVIEQHNCPECNKTFGRKSNLKAHRDSLHLGKKFPCAYCERVFTNRSSMNQHIKKTHTVIPEGISNIILQLE